MRRDVRRRARVGGARPGPWLAAAPASSTTSAASGTATRPSGPPWLAVPPFERPERLAATFRALEGSGVLRHVERLPAAQRPADGARARPRRQPRRAGARPSRAATDPARSRGVDRAGQRHRRAARGRRDAGGGRGRRGRRDRQRVRARPAAGAPLLPVPGKRWAFVSSTYVAWRRQTRFERCGAEPDPDRRWGRPSRQRHPGNLPRRWRRC